MVEGVNDFHCLASALFIDLPQASPTSEPEKWVEVDVSFTPKKIRTVVGEIGKRERAEFKTAFGDELDHLIERARRA